MERISLLKFFFLLAVGIISPITYFYSTDSILIHTLRTASPSAILFSKKKDFVYAYDVTKFEFSDENQSVKRTFSRAAYRKLKGPHRVKLQYFLSLKKIFLLKNPENYNYYRSIFCDYDYFVDSFELGFKPKQIKIFLKKELVHDISCSH